jgi:uncharacterized protein
MKRQDFLTTLKQEQKLELVEESEEICKSYLVKADESLKSAKLLLDNALLENAVSMAYYSMYHATTALMRKVGIKCENHTGNIILLKQAFQLGNLSETLRKTKKERVDKQYYTDFKITKQETEELTKSAEDFVVKMKLFIEEITPKKREEARGFVKEI